MPMKIKLYSEQTKKEAEERGVPELADGTYHFEVEDVEQKTRGTQRPRPCVQVRLKVIDGPSPGPAWDWWNLPMADDDPNADQTKFIQGFWLRASRAVPGLYDEVTERFDEQLLKGLRYKAKVVHEAGTDRDGNETDRLRYRSVRFEARAGAGVPAAAAPAAAPAGAPPAVKPQKFATP